MKRKFLNSVAHNLGFHAEYDLTRWNNLNIQDIRNEGSFGFLASYTTLPAVLREVYSECYNTTYRHQEKVLQNAVIDLFPSNTVLLNARKSSGLVYKNKGGLVYLELDAMIPDLNIGFEYQDPYHYSTQWFSNKPLKEIKIRDKEKVDMMKKLGRTLIIVPCWWDKKVQSLAATIREQRPELVPEYVSKKFKPISQAPPLDLFGEPDIPDVGELMQACFFSDSSIIEYWWMGEKFDGIRSVWNPLKLHFYSKQGRILKIWKILKKKIIPCFLDGELWFGRQNFASVKHAITRKAHGLNIKWQLVHYMAFDYPRPTFKEQFEARYSILLLNNFADHAFIIISPRLQCAAKSYIFK